MSTIFFCVLWSAFIFYLKVPWLSREYSLPSPWQCRQHTQLTGTTCAHLPYLKCNFGLCLCVKACGTCVRLSQWSLAVCPYFVYFFAHKFIHYLKLKVLFCQVRNFLRRRVGWACSLIVFVDAVAWRCCSVLWFALDWNCGTPSLSEIGLCLHVSPLNNW